MSKIANRDLWKADIAWGGDGTGFGAHQPRTVKRAPRTSPTEAQEQYALLQWWGRYSDTKDIDYRLLFSIPNGARLGKDQRFREIEMGRLKAAGLRPGVPDLMLAVPRQPHAGLFVEMKAVDGRTSVDQDELLELLTAQGYLTAVCYGADEAIEAIKAYLG